MAGAKAQIEKLERKIGLATRCRRCNGHPLLIPIERPELAPATVAPCSCGNSRGILVVTGVRALLDDDGPLDRAQVPLQVVGRVRVPYVPRAWQRKLDEARKRLTICVSHRRSGKTTAALAFMIDAALREWRTEPRFAFIAPFLRQCKATAWEPLKRLALAVPGTTVSEGELEVRFTNGARVRLYGGDLPDSLRGIYLDGVILDEFAQMRSSLLDEVLVPAAVDRSGTILVQGTPHGVDAFSALYTRALSDPAWAALKFTIGETGALRPEELALARKTMSEGAYRQEIECDFAAQSDDSLIGYDLVRAAAGRLIELREYCYAPKILACDVARFGSDKSVLVKRQGLAVIEVRELAKMDLMQTASAIAFEIDAWQPDGVFIDQGGLGAGVVDRLRQLRYSVIGVDFGGRALRPEFQNRRAQIWADMKQWLIEGGCLPQNERLLADLVAPRYEFNAAGKLQLESKDDLRARGLPSPDAADALALSFSSPVAPRRFDAFGKPAQTQQKAHDYTAFDALNGSGRRGRGGHRYSPFLD